MSMMIKGNSLLPRTRKKVAEKRYVMGKGDMTKNLSVLSDEREREFSICWYISLPDAY